MPLNGCDVMCGAFPARTQAMIRRRRLWINETHVFRGWCLPCGLLAFFPELAVGFSIVGNWWPVRSQYLATQLGFACVSRPMARSRSRLYEHPGIARGILGAQASARACGWVCLKIACVFDCDMLGWSGYGPGMNKQLRRKGATRRKRKMKLGGS